MIYTAVLLLLLVVQWSFSIRVYPEGEYVSVVHGSFQAVCVGTMSYFVWLRNGIPVNSTFRGTVSLQSGNGVIELHNILEQDNGTNFRCITEGTPPQASTSVILIVQGLLAAVGSLQLTQTQNSAITLTWTAPFTLDIRGVDPDIVGYTVIVSKITINSSINYTTNETSLLYTLPSEDSACSSYLFTVYARNAVGDGEHSSVQYIASLEVVEMNVSRIGDLREFTLIMSGPVYSGELTFVDLDTNERVLKGGSDLTIAGNTISFTSSGLTPSRRYSVTIVASNIGGSAVSFTTISTHDLVDAMATEAIGGGIELSASYAEDSSASGVLFCFMFVTEDGGIDISRTAFLVVDRTTPPGHTLPFNLHPGCYKTYSYDIGSRGVLSTGMAFPAVTSGLTVRSRDDDGIN